MLCVGMICLMVLGLYNWLLMGICVLKKVEKIICEEMNKGGVIEVLMFVV